MVDRRGWWSLWEGGKELRMVLRGEEGWIFRRATDEKGWKITRKVEGWQRGVEVGEG